jgi:hypothetical protein
MVIAPIGVLAQTADEVEAELDANRAFAVDAPEPVTVWSAAPPLGDVAGRATVFFSDFEADNGGGVGTLDWEWGVYAWAGTCGTQYPPATAFSGSSMWATVLNECYNNLGNNSGYSSTGACSNTNTADDSILSFTIDLTGLSEAWLYWWEWYDVYSYWDWAEVYVNGTVVFQHCESSYTVPTQWVQQEVDISAFVGGVATIEFHMMASSVVERSGWFIDDLLILDTQIPVELQSFFVE